MSETKRDYDIGYGKPPRGRPFQRGWSGNPRGPHGKNLSAVSVAALNETVVATIAMTEPDATVEMSEAGAVPLLHAGWTRADGRDLPVDKDLRQKPV